MKCISVLWHGNWITTTEIVLMLMNVSILAEDFDMVILRTSANSHTFFWQGKNLVEWVSGGLNW